MGVLLVCLADGHTKYESDADTTLEAYKKSMNSGFDNHKTSIFLH